MALVLLEALPQWRRIVGGAAVAALVIYGVAGAGQYTYMSLAARGLAPEGATVSIEPASPWLFRWLLLVETRETFQVRRHGMISEAIEAPETLVPADRQHD